MIWHHVTFLPSLIGKDKPKVDPVLDRYANLLAQNFEVAATCYYNLSKTNDTTSTGIAIVVNPKEGNGYQFPDTPYTCILAYYTITPETLEHIESCQQV